MSEYTWNYEPGNERMQPRLRTSVMKIDHSLGYDATPPGPTIVGVDDRLLIPSLKPVQNDNQSPPLLWGSATASLMSKTMLIYCLQYDVVRLLPIDVSDEAKLFPNNMLGPKWH